MIADFPLGFVLLVTFVVVAIIYYATWAFGPYLALRWRRWKGGRK